MQQKIPNFTRLGDNMKLQASPTCGIDAKQNARHNCKQRNPFHVSHCDPEFALYYIALCIDMPFFTDVSFESDHISPLESALILLEHINKEFCIPQQDFENVSNSLKELVSLFHFFCFTLFDAFYFSPLLQLLILVRACT